MADAAGGEEKLSKNELKRRQKAEKKAAEKAEKAKEAAEKAPAAAASDKKKPENAINEEEISPNEYFKIRGAAVEELKQGQLQCTHILHLIIVWHLSWFPHRPEFTSALLCIYYNLKYFFKGKTDLKQNGGIGFLI